MTKNQQIIESLFFVTPAPLFQGDIIKVFGKENTPILKEEVAKLNLFMKKVHFL